MLGEFAGLADAIDDRGRVAVDAPPRLARAADDVAIGAWAELLAAAAVHTLAAGGSAILVVPDHRDQSQLEAALAGRVPADALVRVDARQSSPARYSAFLRGLADVPCIVIGNRSAVYAPVHALGLLALWDDGDPLLAEPLSPGVHARDAALLRQELDGCALIFSGHTRTTDVERLVQVGWVREVTTARRASPRVVLSATREGESRGARVPSAAFAAARTALADRSGARAGGTARLRPRAGVRRMPTSGALRALRRAAACQATGRGAELLVVRAHRHRLDLPALLERTGADGRLGQRAHGRRARPRVPRSAGDRRRRRAPGRTRGRASRTRRGDARCRAHRRRRLPRRDPPGRGADAARRRPADRRVVSALVVERRGARRPRGPRPPGRSCGSRRACPRDLDPGRRTPVPSLLDRAPLRMPPTVRVAALEGPPAVVSAALTALRAAVPELDDDAVLGPVATPEAAARALVRFDYARGAQVTEALRAAVVQQSLSARAKAKGRAPGVRNTLRVRVDVPDLDL